VPRCPPPERVPFRQHYGRAETLARETVLHSAAAAAPVLIIAVWLVAA
jgi:hypothetical protein